MFASIVINLSGGLRLKRGAAATASSCIGIGKLEPSIRKRIHVVDLTSTEIAEAFTVDDDRNAVLGLHHVVRVRLIQGHDVLHAGTPAFLHTKAQAGRGNGVFFRDERFEVLYSAGSERNHEWKGMRFKVSMLEAAGIAIPHPASNVAFP